MYLAGYLGLPLGVMIYPLGLDFSVYGDVIRNLYKCIGLKTYEWYFKFMENFRSFYAQIPHMIGLNEYTNSINFMLKWPRHLPSATCTVLTLVLCLFCHLHI